jgi:hypothetical protein
MKGFAVFAEVDRSYPNPRVRFLGWLTAVGLLITEVPLFHDIAAQFQQATHE